MDQGVNQLFAEYQPLIRRDPDAALAALQAIVAEDPSSADAWELISRIHMRRIELPQAEAVFRKLEALGPMRPKWTLDLALCLYGQGDLEGALEIYGRALRRGTIDAALMVGVILHRLGRLGDARKQFARIILRAKPDSTATWFALRGMMQLLRDMGQPLAADRHAHDLLQRFRRQPKAVSSSLLVRDNAACFGEWFGLVDKAYLTQVLRKAAAEDPAGARFPETFNLPQERQALADFAAAAPADTVYIVKPTHGSGGQGISVVSDLTQTLDRTDVVVQRYLSRPYLVDGLKGHLRIYALVTSADPLRAYVYSDGIVRFAPEPYDPRPERLADIAMHVTNTALHLDHPGLKVSTDPSKDDEGSVWSVQALLRRMAADGHDPGKVFGRISDLVGWFVRALQRDGFFARHAQGAPGRSLASKLFSFDILLDADAQPWLIEVQIAPAATGSALVERINGELYETRFQMGVSTLFNDDLDDAAMAALRRDPDALRRQEIQHEIRARGKFVPLNLG